MNQETFKPISVKNPNVNRFSFFLRCLFDLQLKTIVQFLRPEMQCLPAGRIIDIGAGESPWRDWLPKHCKYQGLDIKNAAEFGMKIPKDVKLYSGKQIPFAENEFSGAFCIEVLEHTQDPTLLLQEIHRVLKKNAPLLLTTPWSARRHHTPYDFHRFTKEQLTLLLQKNGFKNISVKERGNEYCVIFNKLLMIIFRNTKNISLLSFWYKLPLIFLLTPITGLFFVLSHISLLIPLEGSEDPLGYFCKAVKK